MIYLIGPRDHGEHVQDIEAMYKLRYEYFYKNLKWKVKIHQGMEKDEYDARNPHYVIYKDQSNIVKGCARLIEMTNGSMFECSFDFLLPNLESFKKPGIWEISRFAIATECDEEETEQIFLSLIAALSHFGLKDGIPKTYLTLSYPASIELAEKLGIPVKVIKKGKINNEPVVTLVYKPEPKNHEELLQKLSVNKTPVVFFR